jgi:hypothetical protein
MQFGRNWGAEADKEIQEGLEVCKKDTEGL